MPVQLIVTVDAKSVSDVDFKFEINDDQQFDKTERAVVDGMAAACLAYLDKIAEHTGGAVIAE